MKYSLFAHFLFYSSLFVSFAASANEAISSHTLHNGLKVIFKKDPRAPLVMVQIWYAVGGADEPKELLGISHVLEHMMFKGTVRLSGDDFKRINANYGGSLNAITSNNYTYYYQLYPKDYLSLALELEADRMSGLYLRQKDFRTEIQVVMEERRQRTDDNPRALAFEQFRYAAYPNSAYQHPVIGHMHNLKNIELKDLQSWYDIRYAPNNATLVIVGDVDPDKALIQVQRYFGDIRPKILPQRPSVEQTSHVGHRHIDYSATTEVPNLYLGWNVPSLKTNPSDAFALTLIKNILDATASSRLSRSLVRESKILTAASVTYDMIQRGDTLFTITAIPTDNTSLEQARTQIIHLIDQLKITPVGADELERVVSNTLAELVYSQDTLAGQAALIGSLEVNQLDHQLLEHFAQQYSAVTPEKIQHVVTRYFDQENLTTLYLQSASRLSPNNSSPPAFDPQIMQEQ